LLVTLALGNRRPSHARNLEVDTWPKAEVEMDRFVHAANIAPFRKLISESELDASRDEGSAQNAYDLACRRWSLI
jgi:hypothetical protein